MEPIVLFGLQFTMSLVAYLLIAFWYVAPRLSGLPREAALVPLLWVHAFRIVGGTILAPGSVEAGVALGFPGVIWDGAFGKTFPAPAGRNSLPVPLSYADR